MLRSMVTLHGHLSGASATYLDRQQPFHSLFRDIQLRTATTMDFMSNAFCASGASYPNGTFMTFGGNGAVTVGGALGSDPLVIS
jgi:hypothetical protein